MKQKQFLEINKIIDIWQVLLLGWMGYDGRSVGDWSRSEETFRRILEIKANVNYSEH